MSDVAPGPGSEAELSIRMLPEAGMQKTDARVIPCDVPTGVMGPAGEPFSTIARQVSSPKQPALFWSGQKMPPAFDFDALDVVSGVRFTGIVPTSVEQMPPPHVPLVEHAWPLPVPP